MTMEVDFRPKSEVWRGRGHPRREIPAQVRTMADATYRTGHVGSVKYGPEDEAEAHELRLMLVSYAKSLGRRMRIQDDEGVLRFEMVDRGPGRKAPDE